LTPNVWGHKANFTSSLTLDGVDLGPYTMFGEAHATELADKHQATIGIMCHELGHLMLGLPDLYDTDGSSSGIGDWGLMGSGSWNVTGALRGDTPSHMSAWSKVATNFTIPQDIDIDQSGVSIEQAHVNEDARRIWLDKYKLNEYFLVENRQKAGYDAGLRPGYHDERR
jgi:M6 family metalloprotease-like protein